ncbi:MAG: hypothetical protein B5M56_04645 [Desulfococcus sp. 4484_241]|nr:MAG: hypothetical protein B5M56_04645 [Desulfococcus sp. 4484_241]
MIRATCFLILKLVIINSSGCQSKMAFWGFVSDNNDSRPQNYIALIFGLSWTIRSTCCKACQFVNKYEFYLIVFVRNFCIRRVLSPMRNVVWKEVFTGNKNQPVVFVGNNNKNA